MVGPTGETQRAECVNQLLSADNITTSQPLSVQFNPTDMIPNLQQPDQVLRKQHARRGQQHQQQFQQRQERQRQLQRRERRHAQWLDRVYQRRRQRERDKEYFNEMTNRDPLEEPMVEEYNEVLLEAYNYEQMNPQERQETCEQQHSNELQGIPPPRYYAAPLDDLQRLATQQEEQLSRDRLSQTMRVHDMEGEDRIQQHQRNEEDLTQKEQWGDVAFRLQQLQ